MHIGKAAISTDTYPYKIYKADTSFLPILIYQMNFSILSNKKDLHINSAKNNFRYVKIPTSNPINTVDLQLSTDEFLLLDYIEFEERLGVLIQFDIFISGVI